MSKATSQRCPICGKKNVQRMLSHLKVSHPDVDPATLLPSEDAGMGQTTPREPEPPAAPAPPPASPGSGYEAVLAQLMHTNDLLLNQISEQQQRIEELAKNQTEFQQSVIAEMNKIPDVARRVVTGTLDQIMAEAQDKAGGDGTGALAEGAQTPTPSHNRSAMLEQLLPLIVQKLMGGDSSGQTDLVKQITSLQAIANAFNQPMLTGMQMATTMFTAAARAGLKPDEAAIGAQALINDLTPKKPGA